MANGDWVEDGIIPGYGAYRLYRLLDAQAGAADGVWVDVRRFPGFKTVDVSGIGTGTVQMRGSLEATKPADTTDASQIGSDITANGLNVYSSDVMWIKAKKSAAGNSTATTVLLRCVTEDRRVEVG